MKKLLLHWMAALVFVTTAGGSVAVLATPQPTFAACNERLLTFPTWYNGVVDDNCEVKIATGNDGVQKFVLTVGLNIVEMILQLVGYIAVGFIIYGGYKYMISAGSSDGMTKARKTITNAVVGLLISIFSVAIVNVIGGAV